MRSSRSLGFRRHDRRFQPWYYNRFMCSSTLIAGVLGACGWLLIPGCATAPQDKSGTKAPERILKITAPEKSRQVWKDWNGRYVIFAHSENPVRQLSDFSGRKLSCAMIETQSIVGDARALLDAGDVKGYVLGI